MVTFASKKPGVEDRVVEKQMSASLDLRGRSTISESRLMAMAKEAVQKHMDERVTDDYSQAKEATMKDGSMVVERL